MSKWDAMSTREIWALLDKLYTRASQVTSEDEAVRLTEQIEAAEQELRDRGEHVP